MRESEQPPQLSWSPPPLRQRVLAVGAIALAAAMIGAFLARTPFELALLLPLFVLFSLGSTLLRWIRQPSPRAQVVSRVRAMVQEYGGGFYGTAGLSTWVYLEALALRSQWSAASGVRDFLSNLSVDWLLRFGVDSFLNALWASLWPLRWGRQYGFAPMLAAAAVAWLFYRLALRLMPGPTPSLDEARAGP